MNDKKNDSRQKSADTIILRKRAEEKAETIEKAPFSTPASEEVEILLHELTVHQIELEMQNEAL